MYVEKEYGNKKDEAAMLIKMPCLNKISQDYHFDVTKEKKGSERTDQHVKDIAGKDFGQVPVNLCCVF